MKVYKKTVKAVNPIWSIGGIICNFSGKLSSKAPNKIKS